MTTKHLPSDYYENVRVELQDWMERHGFVDAEVVTWVHPADDQTRLEARWSQNGEQHGISNSSPHLLYDHLNAWLTGEHPYAKYGYIRFDDFDWRERAKMILATQPHLGEDFEDYLAETLQSVAAEARKLGTQEGEHKCVSRRVGDPPTAVYLHDGTKVALRMDIERGSFLEVREQAKARAVGVERPEEGKVDLQGIKDAPFLGEQVIDSLEYAKYARKAETELLRRTTAENRQMVLRLAEALSPDMGWCTECQKWVGTAAGQSCPHRKVE